MYVPLARLEPSHAHQLDARAVRALGLSDCLRKGPACHADRKDFRGTGCALPCLYWQPQ